MTGALLLGGLAVAPVATAEADELTGSAFGIGVNVKLINGAVTVSLPPLPKATYPAGDNKSLVKLNSHEVTKLTNSKVQAKAVNASSDVRDGTLVSEASATKLHLQLQDKPGRDDKNDKLGLDAEAVTAKCTLGPEGITGTTELLRADLHLRPDQEKTRLANGLTAVTPEPNTTVDLPGVGKVVLNEQVRDDDGITVNAVHVYLDVAGKLGQGDIIVAQTRCAEDDSDSDGPDPEPTKPTLTATSTPVQPTGTSTPEAPTTSPGTPGDDSSSTTAPGAGDGTDDTDTERLANTGVDGVLTLTGIAAGLLAAGGATFYFLRRRKMSA
ncbi:choice-of-anchor P family protein [Longimycelium tulufanense]|nr:choice-of-anchor P family protein [Longimycelium tulufanense]